MRQCLLINVKIPILLYFSLIFLTFAPLKKNLNFGFYSHNTLLLRVGTHPAPLYGAKEQGLRRA